VRERVAKVLGAYAALDQQMGCHNKKVKKMKRGWRRRMKNEFEGNHIFTKR